MRERLGTCACGATVWWKNVRKQERLYDNARIGHRRQEHICSGGKSFASTIADDHEDLFRAAPWLRKEK
jgi:hypothetical protein